MSVTAGVSSGGIVCEGHITPIKGATKWSLGINIQYSVFYPRGVGGIGGTQEHIIFYYHT